MSGDEGGSSMFALEFETLDTGARAERSTFGTFIVQVNGQSLTEGVGPEGDWRPGPRVSGYHAAEWLLWNWWRLHCEPELARRSTDWSLAHRMSHIGEGYAWPNVKIVSDGRRVDFTASRSRDPSSPYRYLAVTSESVSVEELTAGVDAFAGLVIDRLSDSGERDTNLHTLAADLEAARQDPDETRFRRLEALLGFDPDEAAPADIARRIADSDRMGRSALEELAAHAAGIGAVPLAGDDIATIAKERGFDAKTQDMAQVNETGDMPAWGTCEAWQFGAAMAQALRKQEGLDGEPLANGQLADLAGTSASAIRDIGRVAGPMSLLLRATGAHCRLALRPKWETGRRFDLARLLGDRLCANTDEPLLPATASRTYRQKAQRAFAVELLCPIDAIDDFLGPDLSEDKRHDAAAFFNVSPVAIDRQLENDDRFTPAYE